MITATISTDVRHSPKTATPGEPGVVLKRNQEVLLFAEPYFPA
jgi:hypothetical protein